MPEQSTLFPFARDVVDIAVEDEMSESFLQYSLSVITSRAIPDVRDGLKPVQRRILYAMRDMGLRPDRPRVKSAKVVGDVMGNYHPHGDMAIYETLARMAQPFARNVTLVDPQGNFGTLDDPPAAQRYTECRLSAAAMDMVNELDEETVDFRPSYDGENREPVCLPAMLPNLLVNGTTGIAVGMATSMPTHNLREVFEAIKLVLTKRRPRPTLDELMAVLPGPDFPTGGIVIDEGIRDAYETGRGAVRMRAKAEVVDLQRGRRQGIVVTELPFMVGAERVIGRIKELVIDNKIGGIEDVVNLSDRAHGLRIQITCKSSVNPHAVLADLYRQTPMEDTFGINNVVLVDGVPTTLGLYDMCQHYIDHRLDVIVKRTQFRLRKANDRMHIVEGLLLALDAIDAVIKIIRGSKDSDEARTRLMAQLKLSEIQATTILDMQLRRLTQLEKLKLQQERDELRRTIADLNDLLRSETRQRKTVLTELGELVERYGAKRRTRIVSADDVPVYEAPPVATTAALPDEPCVVTLSTSGVVGRASVAGAKRATPGRHDVLASQVVTSTHATVFAITSDGRALSATANDIADASTRARGAPAAQVFGANKGEQVLALVAPGDEYLVLVTAAGVFKRVAPGELGDTRGGRPVINLKPGDRVAAAFTSPESVDVVIVASDGQCLRTAVEGISVQGRGAGGVAGITLRGDAVVVGAGAVIGVTSIVSVTDKGWAKATEADDIPAKGRGTGGVRLARFPDNQRIALVYVGAPSGLFALMAADDNPNQTDPNPVQFPLEPTKRDLVSVQTERRIHAVGPRRW
ncbi:MAG: DNA topoisomerase 4 subunit A [Actinobacteria bacterium]|nr:MAG: DNA topoisomerase 4 subunit A [Actinomycetota bacterium]